MASTVLYMSMSLDGFIAGPNESWENNRWATTVAICTAGFRPA